MKIWFLIKNISIYTIIAYLYSTVNKNDKINKTTYENA